jgi:hypothetical protein
MGNGYNLFLFAKNELINIDKSEKLFGQISINGQEKKPCSNSGASWMLKIKSFYNL